MWGAMNLTKRPDITDIKAILDDGTEIPLEQKKDGRGRLSQCVFFATHREGDFEITLRLDFGKHFEKREGADPTLDADIRRRGKEYRAGRKHWHQTSKTFENGEWVYVFEFKKLSLRLRFKTQITSQRTMPAGALIVAPPASCDDEGPSREAQELLHRLSEKND
jgi:hypothetical protein